MSYDHWKTTNPDDEWLGPEPEPGEDYYTGGFVLVPCERCGSEGHLYAGHPNDPHPRYVRPCPVCNGEGMEFVPAARVVCEDLDPLVPA